MEKIKITNMIKFYSIVLLNQGPKTGYELKKEIEKHTHEKLSASHIYPFLKKLLKNNLIKINKKGSRDKKEYLLTKKGKEFVNKSLNNFSDIISSSIESGIKICKHCDCKIYKSGYKEKIKGKRYTFCCQHCAAAYKKMR